jgi:hypothetical protein
MKTNVLITRKAPLYFLFGFLSMLVTSCGSYQNSSYYENDGIYGTNGDKIVTKQTQTNPAAVQYKEYFSSLQNTGSSDEIFTDVNNYSNNYNTENDSIQAPSTGYASWGSSPQETSITVYPDSYWSIGFGWGYPYYGYGYGYPYYGYGWGYPYYGWGYPSYGWGYPGYGYGYPGYGYCAATPYAYNYSRRGSSYTGNYNNSIYSNNNRVSSYTRNGVSSRNSAYTRNSGSVVNRTAPTFTNRNSNTSSRNYTQNQSRNSYTQSRTSNSSQNYQRSSNSYTPSSNSYRSSGGGMSGGGTRMSGGGGGGRMSGGGGRR